MSQSRSRALHGAPEVVHSDRPVVLACLALISAGVAVFWSSLLLLALPEWSGPIGVFALATWAITFVSLAVFSVDC